MFQKTKPPLCCFPFVFTVKLFLSEKQSHLIFQGQGSPFAEPGRAHRPGHSWVGLPLDNLKRFKFFYISDLIVASKLVKEDHCFTHEENQ